MNRDPLSGLAYHLPQDRERRGVVTWGRQRPEVRDEELDILERRLLVLLEVEAQPASGEAALTVRLFTRDQRRQLKRLGDRHPANLSRGHLGEHEVVVFQGPPEDRSRMALRGRRSYSRGRDGLASLEGARSAANPRGYSRQRAE
jgi:hypothetical protein